MKLRTLLLVPTLLVSLLASINAGAATWVTDYPQALKTAAAQKKKVLINFTGSDWCVYCKRLKAEVLDTAEFKKYADANLILVEVDFPAYHSLPAAQKAANEKLQNQFKVGGYPALFLTDPQGKIIGRLGYQPGGPAGFLEQLKAFSDGTIVMSQEPQPQPQAQAQPKAATTPSRPAPSAASSPDTLVLKGITGTGSRKLALINSKTFSAGESMKLQMGDRQVQVRCESIEADHVLLQVEGEKTTRKLLLSPAAGK